MKITGAAAAKKYSFDRVVEIGRAVNDQVVSIGSALDHCHVPGRQQNEPIPHDVAIVGAGIHNEPVSLAFHRRMYHLGTEQRIRRALKSCPHSHPWKSLLHTVCASSVIQRTRSGTLSPLRRATRQSL